MALIVTAGSATAESYADEAYARTHFAKTPRNAQWQALGADLQTYWLRQAMLCIDAQSYIGSRSNPLDGVKQALEFPRKATFQRGSNNFTGSGTWQDKKGREWTDTDIPDDLKIAQCEQALAMAENDQFLNDKYKTRRITAGQAELEINTGRDLGTLCTIARLHLKPFLTHSKGSSRVERN